MTAQIVTFIIPHYPDGEIGVDIVEPGFKRIRIAGVPKQSGRHNGAAGGIMTAINTVGIRHAAGDVSIPGQIGAILSERAAEPDIGRGVHARI